MTWEENVVTDYLIEQPACRSFMRWVSGTGELLHCTGTARHGGEHHGRPRPPSLDVSWIDGDQYAGYLDERCDIEEQLAKDRGLTPEMAERMRQAGWQALGA